MDRAGRCAGTWCLIDTEHRVADLYGMVNVPQAVWIDEAGRIVRPPENAGSTDHFRLMDRTTRTLAPEHAAAREAARTAYLDAVRQWVLTGRYALPADAARGRLPRITPEIALAQAHFRLGVWLRQVSTRGGGRGAPGRGKPAASGVVEHVAAGSRSGRGGQGERGSDSGSACRRWGRRRTIRWWSWGESSEANLTRLLRCARNDSQVAIAGAATFAPLNAGITSRANHSSCSSASESGTPMDRLTVTRSRAG